MQGKEWISWKNACVLLIAFSAVSLSYNVGGRPFIDYDEGIYAQVMQDTAVSGNPWTLQSRSNPFLEKPPLYFWSGILANEVISSPEFAYRIPSVLAAILCIALVMFTLFATTGSYSTAFLGGLILLLSPPFFEAARQVRLDTMVTAGILLAFYTFIRGLNNPQWFLGTGPAIALAILAKSIIGLFAGPVIVIWALIQRDYKWLSSGYFWGGSFLGLLVAAPWHVYQSISSGHQFWRSYVGFSVIDRFQENVLGGVKQSNIYYINYLLSFAFPWTWLLPVAVVRLYTDKSKGSYLYRSALAFGVQALFLISIFFVASTKIPYYLLPAFPFVALFLATVWHIVFAELRGNHKKIALWLIILMVLLGVVNTIFVGYHYQKMMHVNEIIASNEKDIATILKESPAELPTYTYEYPYWDTIRYYSGRSIEPIQLDQILDHSFHLVIRGEFYDRDPFPPELKSHLTLLYEGDAAVLLRFDL